MNCEGMAQIFYLTHLDSTLKETVINARIRGVHKFLDSIGVKNTPVRYGNSVINRNAIVPLSKFVGVAISYTTLLKDKQHLSTFIMYMDGLEELYDEINSLQTYLHKFVAEFLNGEENFSLILKTFMPSIFTRYIDVPEGTVADETLLKFENFKRKYPGYQERLERMLFMGELSQ